MPVIAPSFLLLLLIVVPIFVYRREHLSLFGGLILTVLGLLGFITAMVLMHHDRIIVDRIILTTICAFIPTLIGVVMLAFYFTKTKQD